METGREKWGLALSGGGFRASFFHLGVLARLGELGLLRRLEVISTVSGGSILGALYYVHVKRLLEQNADAEIADKDYLEIMLQIERDFLAAVQRNMRMRTFLNPLKNIRMALANYSRSDRVGELYDELLYRPVLAPARPTPIEMRELKIHPRNEPEGFHPRTHNRDRGAKVPILLLNATTLNTGHNWRFEASRMGEPAYRGREEMDVDKNVRLPQPPSYDAITPRQQTIELGLAVAASACVPGIFHPLAISSLYDRGYRVQLVDGGVYDNQGIQGLVDEECTHYIVSDASGQMLDEADPPSGILSVLPRSNEILMDRVREEEVFRLVEGGGRSVAFMHLRRGLPVEAIAWIDKSGRPAPSPDTQPVAGKPSSQFGVDPRVQEGISKVRTDLDSFTDVEAYSLMLDGYLMSEPEVRSAFSPVAPAGSAGWNFLRIRPWMEKPTPGYLAHLAVAHERLFKVFRLSWTVTLLTALGLALIGWGLWRWQGESILEWWGAAIQVKQLVTAAVILGLGFIPWASRTFKLFKILRSPSEFLVRLVLRGLLPAVGSLLVWIHLQVFDRLFLSLGRIQRLPPVDNRR